jgi:signal transduction histidine kinase
VSLHLGLLRTRIDDGEGRETIAQLEDEVRQATHRLRQLLFELRPPSLDREGLIAALGTYLERMREDDGLDYTLVNNLSAEPGEEGRAILYRIAIEALANIRKHAGAALVNVAVEEADGGVLVRIADDGAGFVADGRAPEPGHLGLVGMRERAEMAGGRWRIESTVGAGTTVEFWIPEEIAVSLAAS